MEKITIFGDGNCTSDSALYKLAFEVGAILASKGISIVNGGYGGVMEASFKGASQYPVERIAIVTDTYSKSVSKYATIIINTKSYLERLSKLLDTGEMHIFLEGGSGTLLEFVAYNALFERKIICKKAICIGNRWEKLLEFLDETFDIKTLKQFIYIVQTLDEFKTVLETLLI